MNGSVKIVFQYIPQKSIEILPKMWRYMIPSCHAQIYWIGLGQQAGLIEQGTNIMFGMNRRVHVYVRADMAEQKCSSRTILDSPSEQKKNNWSESKKSKKL